MGESKESKADLLREVAALRERVAQLESRLGAGAPAPSARESRLMRVLQAIRHVNQLLVRETDRTRLIAHACAILTDTLSYHTACVGLFDGNGAIVETASSGVDESFDRLCAQLDRGYIPVCVKSVLDGDGFSVFERADCGDCPMAEEHRGHSIFASRLEYGGQVFGVLVVSLPPAYSQDADERGLFPELAGDLGFALHRIARDERLLFQARVLSEIRDHVTLTDLEGRIVYVNQATCALLQRSEAELLGQSVAVYGEDAGRGPSQREIVERACSEGEWRGEMINTAKDGTRAVLDCHIWLIRDADGAPKYLGGVSRDITARKRSEADLRLSNSLMAATIESTADGILVISRAGKVTRYNRKFLELWRIPAPVAERLNDRRLLEYVLPQLEDSDAFVARIQTLSAAPESSSMGELPFKDGSICEWYSQPQWLDGEIAGRVWSFRDVTEQRRVARALEEAHQRMLTVFDGIKDLIYVADMETYELLFINAYGREAWGDVRGTMCWSSIQDGQTGPCPFCTNDLLLLEDGSPAPQHIWEFQNTHNNRWYECRDSAIHWVDGRLVRLEIAADITERKLAEQERQRMEQQIQQTQKLESLGVLAGGIAHDFNNILMAVLGYGELALDGLPASSPAREDIGELLTAARRAADLCRQMLAYTGKASLAFEQMHLRALVEEMTHLLKSSISKKAILNLHLERGLPPIEADPSQVRQVVMNLIINASEAIGERSGVINVSAGATRCDAEYLAKTELADDLSPGLYVHIEVSDTGCGMNAETKARIFEPFFTTKFTGRGLGLAAVLGIVRSHRGAIKVYSEPGKGSTFKALFPAVEEHDVHEADAAVDKERRWRGHGTVLLVDDEESLRAMCGRVLERMGLDVLIAEDGREAVECYRAHGEAIDVVILDLTMPHMDGGQTFGELRRINPEVRVILASGYSKEDVASRFSGKGLAGVIQKPYSRRVLTEMLSRILPESKS